MELTTIRELFKDRESYLGKKVTIGGWFVVSEIQKTFGFIVVNEVLILSRFRLYIMMRWRTLRKFLN